MSFCRYLLHKQIYSKKDKQKDRRQLITKRHLYHEIIKDKREYRMGIPLDIQYPCGISDYMIQYCTHYVRDIFEYMIRHGDNYRKYGSWDNVYH